MDLWIWSEYAWTLVRVETVKIKLTGSRECVVIACSAFGEEVPLSVYDSYDDALRTVKKIVMELNTIAKSNDNVKVLAVKSDGQVVSSFAVV